MSESDRQLRDALSGAFDKVHAPEQLKMRTFEMIEAQRMRQTDGVVDQADAADGQADIATSDAFRTNVAAGDAFQADVADDTSIPTKKKIRVITSLRAKIALAACAVLIALGIWAAIDFNGIFTWMHTLLFAQGNWIFDADSLLITLFPEAFWAAMAGLWILSSIVLALLIGIVGKILAR